MIVPACPLSWPLGWRRTEAYERMGSCFGRRGASEGRARLTISDGVRRVLDQLSRMHADGIIISSNLTVRLDGLPRSRQEDPVDPGVAVYWSDNAGNVRSMAIDQYDRVAYI